MKKNNVLFMLGSYYKKPYANGICTHQLALEMKKRDFNVDVLCYTNCGDIKPKKKDDINVYFVKNSLALRIVNYSNNIKNAMLKKIVNTIGFFIHRVNKILFYPILCVISPLYYNRYKKTAEKLMKKNKYDIVVGVYHPVEAILSGNKIKSRYPETKFIIYTLDTLTNMKIKSSFIDKINNKIGFRIERKVYKNADLIVNMFCHRDHYQHEKYNEFKSKMIILDIPLISEKKSNNKIKEKVLDDNKVNFIYSGAVPNDPSYYCDFFEKLNHHNNKICLNFFGRGEWDDTINKYHKKNNSAIVNYGYIDHDRLMQAFQQATGFVNWEKEHTKMVSSKVLEYISTGKKIIHFNYTKNDVMLYYLRKYENALIIHMEDDIDYNIKKAEKFIKSNNTEHFEDIKNKLIENTPEYSINQILKGINFYNN